MSDTRSEPDFIHTSCPSCGETTAAVEVAVHSGPWERLFLRCANCQRGLVAEWTNTHEPASSARHAVNGFAA